MRIIFFTLLVTVLTTSVNGQTSIHPIASICSNLAMYTGPYRHMNSQIGGGINIGSKWNILSYAGYSSTRGYRIRNKAPEHLRIDYFNWMIKGQYRFLSKSKISPLAEIGIGTGFKSKYSGIPLGGSGHALDTNFYHSPGAIVGYYTKTKVLFTAKLYAVYRLRNFEFQVGGGYRRRYYDRRHPWKSDEIINGKVGGYELSLAVNYTFKAKKD
ncbi:MAG: hypothetical protein JKY09_00055 [Crocinitomicaceae bacterium]|nr:hypothetical protein [Crocinitomicaceae bacterium]